MKPRKLSLVKASMPADLATKAIDILEAQDGKAALELLKELVVSAASGDAAPAAKHAPAKPPAAPSPIAAMRAYAAKADAKRSSRKAGAR